MPISQYVSDPQSAWEGSKENLSWLWRQVLAGLDLAGRPFHAANAPIQAIQEGRDPLEAARAGWAGEEEADWRDILRQQTQWWSLPSMAASLLAPAQYAANWIADPLLRTGTDYPTAREQARETAVQVLGTAFNLEADPLNLLDVGIPALARRSGPAMDWLRQEVLRPATSSDVVDAPLLRSVALEPTSPEGKALREEAGGIVRAHKTTVHELAREMRDFDESIAGLSRELVRVPLSDPISGRTDNLTEGLIELWALDQAGVLPPSFHEIARLADPLVWEAARETGLEGDLLQLAARLQTSRIAALAPLLSRKPTTLGEANVQAVVDLIDAARQGYAESLARRYSHFVPQPGDVPIGAIKSFDQALKVNPGLRNRWVPGKIAEDVGGALHRVNAQVILEQTSEARTTLQRLMHDRGLPRFWFDQGGHLHFGGQEFDAMLTRNMLAYETYKTAAENVVLNFLSGSKAKYREAQRLLDQIRSGKYEGTMDLGTRRLEMHELGEEAKSLGLLVGTRRADLANLGLDVQDLENFTPGTPFDPMVMDEFELNTRLAHWLGWISQGKSPEEAAKEMRWWLGDVSDLSAYDLLRASDDYSWMMHRLALPRELLLAVEAALLAEPVARTTQGLVGGGENR